MSTTGRQPAAMGSPTNAALARRARSIRRTSHIDMRFTDGHLELDGGARDMLTSSRGVEVLDAATLTAAVGPDGRLTGLTLDPPRTAADELLGIVVRGGFRDAIEAALPDEAAAGTALLLLLDDLPVANLISGYALLYSGNLPVGAHDQGVKVDVCSGWRASGTMMVSVRAGDGVPVTVGPPAPRLEDERADDPLGWHDLRPLPIGSMRRRRLIDVHVNGTWEVAAMFRDTHVDETGDETVLHEYSLSASVDPIRQTFLSCAAVPRVLPWVECPVAAASADRLVGQHVSSVRDLVRAELRGTSTCTHLNDLLRSLGDVGRLAATLTTQGSHADKLHDL